MTSATDAARQSRTALRLAGRQLRRSPREGMLVAALVALPAVAIMLIATVSASQHPTTPEQLNAELGQSEAWVRVLDDHGSTIVQSPTNPEQYESAARPSSVDTSGDPYTAADVESLLPSGASVISVQTGTAVVGGADAAVRASVVQGEAWDTSLTGMYDLVSGSAPTSSDQVMMSPDLADHLDVAVGDTVTLDGADSKFTVTGLVEPRADSGDGTVFASPGTLALDDGIQSFTWYLPDHPLSWADVQALNDKGLIAYSRKVVDNPPADAPQFYAGESATGALVATAAVGLIAAMLLAGAGFVVTFRRQRHSFALLAATGATRMVLTFVGVARGVWLGLAGGIVGAAAGIAGGFGWVAFLLTWGDADAQRSTWGYHVPWSTVVAVVLYGALVGAIAAAVPAVTAARLDVIGVMRGSVTPRRTRHWPAVAGIVALPIGAFVLMRAAHSLTASVELTGTAAYNASGRGSTLLAGGAALIFVGLALLTPSALRVAARLAARAPITPRIAMRDLARNVGRTTPVVAAIAITVAIGSGVLMTLDRDWQQFQSEWQPNAPIGYGTVPLSAIRSPDAQTTDTTAAAIKTTLPDATTTVVSGWASNFDPSELPADSPGLPSIAVPEANLCPVYVDGGQVSKSDIAHDPRCQGSGANLGQWVLGAAVGDADTLRAVLGTEPSPDAVSTLENGGVVVFNPALLGSNNVTIAWWDYNNENYPNDNDSKPASNQRLSATYQAPAYVGVPATYAIMSPSTAATLGWPVTPSDILVDAPDPITAAQQAAINADLHGLSADPLWLYVERGPDDSGALAMAIGTIVVVLLLTFASTAIALALARSEARRDDFTLASLGADPRMARGVAAWQGALIAFLALSIGLEAAIAWSWVDSSRFVDVTYGVPWVAILGTWIVLPACVGAVSWVFTKVPRAIHYRLAA